MSDEVRSTHQRRKRILLVSNPDDADAEPVGEDAASNSYSPYIGYPVQSHPISNPQYAERPPTSKAHIPSPLTTNLPATGLGQYPSSRSNPSNPALSSPSSTSSRAFESTPPPSTPGQSNPPDDLSSEGTLGQEAVLVGYPDSSELTPPSATSTSRTMGFINRIRLSRPGHSRRLSSNTRPATSPTTSVPEYLPSTSSSSINDSAPEERITLLVTRDAEHLVTVDVTGARNRDVAFIRERIFAKLQIEDDEQPRYSIYRTEIGRFAIGDALTDEQLLQLCIERGDERGSIKLLVSHSHASVHEPVQDASQASPTVNTIPPPVLPSMYAPLRPQRRSSRSRRDSVSSTSERQPLEASAGYDASVSDDLDVAERESRRPPLRSLPPQQAPPPRSHPLPPRPRSPAGYGRSQSPGGLISPDRGQAPYHSPVVRTERARGSGLPTPPGQMNSPEVSRFHESSSSAGSSWGTHLRSGSEATVERERLVQQSENMQDYAPYRRYREADEREREREAAEKARSPNCATPKERSGGLRRAKVTLREPNEHRQRYDGWALVPPNVHTSENGARSRPPAQDSHASPSRSQGLGSQYTQLQIPRPPHVPIPPPPSDSRRDGKRQAGKAVPSGYIIRYKDAQVPGKAESFAPQSPPGRSYHLNGAKSMNDLRSQFSAQGAPYGSPNGSAPRRPPAALPLSSKPSSDRSLPGGPGYEGGMPIYQEAPSSSETGIAKSFEGSRGPLSSPTMSYMASRSTNQQNYTSPPQSSATFLGPSPSSQDPYPRPHSSLGSDPATPYRPNRVGQSPNGPDNVSPETPYRPMVSVPATLHQQVPNNYRDDFSHSVPSFGPRPQPRSERPGTDGYSLATRETSTLSRVPRTPPRSPVTGKTPPLDTKEPEPEQRAAALDATLPVQRTLSSLPVREDETPSSAESTLRRDDFARYLGLLDSNSNSSGSNTVIAPTIVSTKQQPYNASARQPSPPRAYDSIPSTILSSTLISGVGSDESDSEVGTIWAKPPPRAANPGRPILPPIDTDSPPSSRPNPLPVRDASRIAPANSPPVPGYIPEPLRARTRPSVPSKKLQDQRTSRFDNNFEVTWAPRPPPEEVFERLQEYFPEHDIDEPVIEAPSGGTSPTSAEPSAPLPAEKQKFRHKKSIRVVAAEHKRRVDRTSRMEPAANASPLLRKRNTKLWGSRLEEVPTHDQAILAQAASSTDASPGTAKPIFRWVRGEMIGKGTYGRVYLALNATTGEMIAVKQVEMPRTASDKDDSRQVSVVEALKLESETLKDLDHPNIVQYLGFEETPTFLSIFLEYVPGGSIASCLRKHGKFDEEVTKSFTGQILSGLEYLHSKGILHRDLKADNILVETTGICKISDFGISKRTDDINMAGAYTSMQGTVFWMAPEVIDANKKGYNSKIDIWSVGCVVFEMWTGQRPWSGREAMAVLLQLYQTKQGPPVPQEVILSPLADDFRQKCFAMNPDERPTAAELRLHPYLELQPDWTFNGFK